MNVQSQARQFEISGVRITPSFDTLSSDTSASALPRVVVVQVLNRPQCRARGNEPPELHPTRRCPIGCARQRLQSMQIAVHLSNSIFCVGRSGGTVTCSFRRSSRGSCHSIGCKSSHDSSRQGPACPLIVSEVRLSSCERFCQRQAPRNPAANVLQLCEPQRQRANEQMPRQ